MLKPFGKMLMGSFIIDELGWRYLNLWIILGVSKSKADKIKSLIIWFSSRYRIGRVLVLKNCPQFKSNCRYIGNTENRGGKQHQEEKSQPNLRSKEFYRTNDTISPRNWGMKKGYGTVRRAVTDFKRDLDGA